jgi:Retroviral aspartyl protease
MSVSPYLDVYSVTIANISRNLISVPITIGSSKQTVETLIDSGAGGLFIDQNFAKNFDINYLDKPVKAYNVDEMENKWGTINAYINLKFSLGEQKFKKRFYVTGLEKQRIILGFPWLHKYNPIIDWKKGEITFNPSESTGDALWKKANEFDRNNNLKLRKL